MQYVSWAISALSLLVALFAFLHTVSKDKTQAIRQDVDETGGIKESLLKANMKLDQVCSTTNETRADIKAMNKDMQLIDRRIVILERDMEAANNEIKTIKERIDND